MDGEFALVIYDEKNDKFMAARDPIGIRAMFYGKTVAGDICFASEMKALSKTCETVMPFPPGHVFDGEKFVRYTDMTATPNGYTKDDEETICKNINKLLTEGVVKRLQSDVPVGFLLSGGLDSSLVCAIAARHLGKPIRTFAVGIVDHSIDTKYARQVAEYIGSEHTEVLFTKDDIFNSLSHLIYLTETFDITTIRASIGMYLVCKYIREDRHQGAVDL